MRRILAIPVLLVVALLAVAAPALAAGDLELRVAENPGSGSSTYFGSIVIPPAGALTSGQDGSGAVVGGQNVR